MATESDLDKTLLEASQQYEVTIATGTGKSNESDDEIYLATS